MNVKSICFLFLVFLIQSFIVAQITPDTLWTKTFGGIEREQALSVTETFDAGYIIVGAINSYGNGGSDAWMIKVDENGNETWNKTFGGTLNDRLGSVQQTTGGGYILAGFTESFGNGGSDAWLIKVDENGNEIWSKIFGGTSDDLASFAQPTSDGGFILTGSTQSLGNGAEDIWLIKVDGNGDEIWNKTYGGSFGERAYTVYQTDDNGYILAGRTESYGNGSLDAWLIKTDANGVESWNRTFGGTEADNAYSLQITFDGGYILAGYTKSSGSGEEDIWLIKTNESGDEIWNKKYGGSGIEVTYLVHQTADSGYFISGFTNSAGNGGMDIWLIRTDTNGNVLWDKTYGGSVDDLAFSGQPTSDGGYIAAGSTYSFGNGQDDFYLIKLNSDGLTGIGCTSTFPEEFKLFQNYPNPFNPTTLIKYNLPRSTKVVLKIFNSLGQEVNTLVNIYQSSGSKEVIWDGTNDSGDLANSGIYIYQLRTSDKQARQQSRKMLLVK